MMDTCTLRIRSVTVNDYGEEVETFTETPGVACGLDVTGGIAAREQRRANGTIATVSATLRLSLDDGAGLTEEDAVTVTHRNGELLTPQQGTRLLQIGRAFDHIATALQRDFIQGAQIRLVINNKHGSAGGIGRHG